jgi:hypothetical protein
LPGKKIGAEKANEKSAVNKNGRNNALLPYLRHINI